MKRVAGRRRIPFHGRRDETPIVPPEDGFRV